MGIGSTRTGSEDVQLLLGSAQPVLHHFVTQRVAAGKPPGQLVRTKLQRCCAPSMAVAGAGSSPICAERVASITILSGNEAKRRKEEENVEGTHL